jgi:CheY-like chemotaxis protein
MSARESARDAQPGAAVRPLRVLVVDDNADSAESLALLLGLDGHETQVVHDGMAALERAAAFRPEVVFLDINLPKLDGYGVVGRLRTHPDLARTLFVAMTGYGDEEARLRSAAAGFHHHLVKPMDLDALGALLLAARGG